MSDSVQAPRGWRMDILGRLGAFSKGKGISKKDTCDSGIPCIRYAEIYTDYDFVIKKFKSYIPHNYTDNTKKLSKNDIIFAGSGETIEDIGKSVAFVGTGEAYVGGDAVIFSPKKDIDSIFLSYQLNDDIRREQLRKLGQGSSVIHIYSTELKQLAIELPPLPEQKKIAAILTCVDDVIEKTEAQISKLQDLKKGMMTELLTKGIGHTEFVDSPVGRIPKGWEVKNLQQSCQMITNGFVGATRDIYNEGGVPYILCQNIRPNNFIDYVFKRVKDTFHNHNKRSWLQEGDVLTVQTGAGNGDTCVVPKKYIGANCHALIISRVKSNFLNPHFLSYYMNSDAGQRRIQIISTGGAHPHLNTTELRKELIPVPPIEEQNKIAQILKSVEDNINSKLHKKEQFQSLKKALMNDLLTGKKRVSPDN